MSSPQLLLDENSKSGCCRCSIGDSNNIVTAILLLQQAETIERFWSHPEAGFLLLRPTT